MLLGGVLLLAVLAVLLVRDQGQAADPRRETAQRGTSTPRGGEEPEQPTRGREPQRDERPGEDPPPGSRLPRDLRPANVLTRGFTPNPRSFEGRAGGPRDGSQLRGNEPHTPCIGHFASEPQHTLIVREDMRLRIVARAQEDLTIMIERSTGQGTVRWCNDDFEGLDPGVVENFPAGQYQVFVGTYGRGASAPYTLSVEHFEHTNRPTTTPGRVTITRDSRPNPVHQNAQASGTRDASTWFDILSVLVCPGFFPDQPQHEVTIAHPMHLRMVASPENAGVDLVMVVDGPGGAVCNDDFQGLDPGFERYMEAGTYRVSVGTLQRSTTPQPYRLTLERLQQ